MNTGDTNTRRDGEDPQALKLAAVLKELPARRVFVPPAIDDALLRAARRHLAQPRPAEPPWSWAALLRPLAIACVALLCFVWFLTKPPQSFAREDLNRDGRVDILDAFQLAREAGQGGPDLNGDGRVDAGDATVIAERAVQLEKPGGRS